MKTYIDVLLTYDVSGRQDEVRNAMLQKQYLTSRKSVFRDCAVILPASTLWKQQSNPGTVLQELKAIVADLSKTGEPIKIRRAIALDFDGNWDGICGEEFSE